VSRTLSGLQAVILGLVVVVALGLGAVGVFAVGSRGWFGNDSLQVRVGFPEIRGVEVGTRVRIQGIDAGEVAAITPPTGPESPVELRLRIKSEYRHLVRVSSTVQIVSEGMLGGKVIEIRPPIREPGKPDPDLTVARNDDLLKAGPSTELGDVISTVGSTLQRLEKGEGTLGKIITSPELHNAVVAFLHSTKDAAERSKDTMAAIQRDADALGKLPIIRGYVQDPVAILVRAKAERNRRTFAEGELFEPGRAVLTASGKGKLDNLASWLEGLKHKGSEVVVVSYADSRASDAKLAPATTRQQSEAVVNYLRTSQKIHKLGWVSSRKVTALGMGTQPPPQPEREELPPARIEVIVFVPQT